MKWLMAITLCAATAFGGTCRIITYFKSPCVNAAYGIDYHGGYLYHVDTEAPFHIYQTTTTGSLVRSIPNAAGAWDLDRTADGFWACSGSSPLIWHLTTTGSLKDMFVGPSTLNGRGITAGGDCLWYTNYWTVYKLTLAGSVMASFAASRTTGLFWEAPYLWLTVKSTSVIFQVTTTGSIVDNFPVEGVGGPVGITRGDGDIWFTAGNRVYRTRICYTAVAPASLGRVKALYR